MAWLVVKSVIFKRIIYFFAVHPLVLPQSLLLKYFCHAALGTSSTFAGTAFTEGVASILDFNRAEGDKIQVYGSASDYTLSPFFSGTSIAYQGDVIGIVTTSITLSDLKFVAPIILPPIFPTPIFPLMTSSEFSYS